MDQQDLAALKAAELEQALMGGSELDRNRRGVLDRHARRDMPGRARSDGRDLRVRPVRHRRNDRLTRSEVTDALADLPDDAARLVPDDVRSRRQRTLPAAEQVTSLQADDLDVEEQPALPDSRVGHVLVLKYLRTAGYVADGRPHPGATVTGSPEYLGMPVNGSTDELPVVSRLTFVAP
jgi:hypothetical protein